jgi:hypothetical protein
MGPSTTKTAAEDNVAAISLLWAGRRARAGQPFSGRFDGFPNAAAAASFKQTLIAFGLVDMKQLKQNDELCVPDILAIDPRPSLVSLSALEGLLASEAARVAAEKLASSEDAMAAQVATGGAEPPPTMPTATSTDKRPAPLVRHILSWTAHSTTNDRSPLLGPLKELGVLHPHVAAAAAALSGGGCCGPPSKPGLDRDVRLHRTLITFGSPSEPVALLSAVVKACARGGDVELFQGGKTQTFRVLEDYVRTARVETVYLTFRRLNWMWCGLFTSSRIIFCMGAAGGRLWLVVGCDAAALVSCVLLLGYSYSNGLLSWGLLASGCRMFLALFAGVKRGICDLVTYQVQLVCCCWTMVILIYLLTVDSLLAAHQLALSSPHAGYKSAFLESAEFDGGMRELAMTGECCPPPVRRCLAKVRDMLSPPRRAHGERYRVFLGRV